MQLAFKFYLLLDFKYLKFYQHIHKKKKKIVILKNRQRKCDLIKELFKIWTLKCPKTLNFLMVSIAVLTFAAINVIFSALIKLPVPFWRYLSHTSQLSSILYFINFFLMHQLIPGVSVLIYLVQWR